ncbi:MAG: TonB-dependent receptor plug domain-containing protein [Prolixibacteraceae bacterium]|nr:TonB-dependent receptor plug domain-containing protein [Prolixibacteraceae bacterium]
MLKKIAVSLCLFALASGIFAQSPQVIRGELLSKRTGEPVSFASIYIQETGSWTSSDRLGLFVVKLSNIPFFTIHVHCLGFETYSRKFESALLSESNFRIEMVPISYDMDEITVLSKNDNGISTSSIIGNAAIEHVQPTSLADVMQLLPGNLSANPDLRSAQRISIREIGDDHNSAMGTAIMVDGSPVSNDANIQTFSTSRSDDNFSTVVGSGLDLRQIPTDNIESVEVIKGIPSVTFGDLTSGVVLIKTKAGYTPLEVKLKTDPKIKQITFGKGLSLKSIRSNLNFNFDYLQSFDDLRSKYNGFNRLTAEVGFSKIFDPLKIPLTYHAKVSYYETIDDEKTDPDAMVSGERIRSKDRGLRFNMYGKWSPELKLLTSLDYSFSVSYAHQISSEDKYRSTSGIQMISTSLTEGENYGIFLPSEQFTSYTIDGKPVTVFGQITANKFINFHNGITNKILYGFDYRLNANYGDGQIYDIVNPPFISSYTVRPRKYRDIPALQNYSVYLEDKLLLTLGKTFLDVQAGFRLNNFQSSGVFKSGLGFYAEPRFNAQYSFLSRNNNSVFDKMAVGFGIGKTFKSPSLHYLYPDKAYFDLGVLSFYAGDPLINTSIINTRIYETANAELKPSENLKIEASLIFRFKKVNGIITVFRENLSNGFDFASNYLFINYDRYQPDNIPAGTKPDPQTLVKIPSIAPVSYRMPVNNQETQKSGVEFSFEFGKISSIYTSFTLDGAWLRTKRINSTVSYQFQPASASANPYLYVGIYPEGESKISERLNTNLRMVTQIPKLRLILSTTLQTIWYDSYYFPEYDEAPIYLVYADGSTKTFTPEMRTNPDYIRFVDLKSQNYYLKEVMSPLFQTNFRLSKEIYDKMKLSFYVNNAVNYRPQYEYKRAGSFIRRNPSVYFGAELKVML